MQPNAYAARAYSQNTRSMGAPRTVEYQAFARVTALLNAAAKPDAPAQDRIQAILQNNKLWGVLANDLLSDENALPQDLRAQLLSLSEFARKHGLRAMSGEAEIETLVDINVTIMRGLRGQETAAPAIAAPSQDAGAAAPSSSATL